MIISIGTNSFGCTPQIPDDSFGSDASRCGNCGKKATYYDQICRSCNVPFIGPIGFPQWIEWQKLSPTEKNALIKEVCASEKYGRIGYKNVAFMPLTAEELFKIERLSAEDAQCFARRHGIVPDILWYTLRFR